MKRKDDTSRKISVSTLSELDALVGKHLTGETPCIHWMNSRSDFQFDSVEEAVEAVHDPLYRGFTEEDPSATTVVTEVREFRPYSTDLALAWQLVENLSHTREVLSMRRNGETWESAFGERDYISAPSAPIALCLAALRTRGIEVECKLESPGEIPAAGVSGGKIGSLYAR